MIDRGAPRDDVAGDEQFWDGDAGDGVALVVGDQDGGAEERLDANGPGFRKAATLGYWLSSLRDS